MEDYSSVLLNRVVLVTGASGFIGRHLVHRLCDLGSKVAVLVRSAQRTTRGESWWNKVRTVVADIHDAQAVNSAVKETCPEVVIHLAAHGVAQPYDSVQTCAQTNVLGTANLLEACRELRLLPFIQLGTSAEYGGAGSPFVEDSAPAPISPYGASKAAAVILAQTYHRTYGMPVVVLRPFQVYGPGQNTKFLIPHIIRGALLEQHIPLTCGEQIRDFVFVTDVVDGILKAVCQPKAIGGIFNLCSGTGWQVRDIAAKIVRLAGLDARLQLGALHYRTNEIFDVRGDPTRAQTILGWRPKIDIETGIRLALDWYRRSLEKGLLI